MFKSNKIESGKRKVQRSYLMELLEYYSEVLVDFGLYFYNLGLSITCSIWLNPMLDNQSTDNVFLQLGTSHTFILHSRCMTKQKRW
jgi:hypothetical protein